MVNGLLQDQYGFRRLLMEELVRDLVGPREEDEILTDAPLSWYAGGVLWPGSGPQIDPERQLDEGDDYDELALPDPGVALANARYPSSMAITFAVQTNRTGIIRVEVSAARYVPLEDDGSEPETEPSDPQGEGTGAFNRARREIPDRWRRVAIPPELFDVRVGEAHDMEKAVEPGLQVFVRVRPADRIGLTSVTVALVNRRKTPPSQLRDSDSYFQPRISVSDPDGKAVFGARAPAMADLADDELASYRLLYRHAATFAVGHGCSATWNDADPDHPAYTTRVESTFVPFYDLPISDSNPSLRTDTLDMSWIGKGDRSDVTSGFRELESEYRSWIRALKKTVASLPADLQEAAHQNLTGCSDSADRIAAGISLLENDDTAWEAFQLANEAMLTQRARSDWIKDGKPTPQPSETDQTWRPFQIAFILLCLPGIADRYHDDREVTDLLWFPTGGGKTEAYLGLIAFTVLHRRLVDPESGGGLTALMRYTLRLLTIQQFERASLLMAALELTRRGDEARLGKEPIGIGLWVGGDATPNTLTEAKKALAKLANGAELAKGNPVQIHACPWCGTRLSHGNYWVDSGKARMVVECPDDSCPFSRRQSRTLPIGRRGLPVFIVDEEVYRYRPSLLIATVDKFAGLPWRERAAALFNIGDNPPPELIIQDELHLISGPLGTLTGLYETIIDHLCTVDGRGPKVVASTATIRRAGSQGEALFNRTVSQFPPPGLDARNSFFAVEADPDRRGTRRYVGVMAAGVSHATLMIRVYASLLQAALEMPGSDPVRDPYWTLVGYFNSLRVLGGARMQVQDDVGDRVALLAQRGNERKRDQVIELTSRESSSRIPAYLAQMSVEYPDLDAVDVILATNMISVGVDVNRLGLMAVMGQPPSTSEYIQATSRVGRAHPGLVVAIYNAHRSRDRSHYENFIGYHNAIYRQVEATSVTPFSPRARDRAIHAVVVGLARMMFEHFRPNNGAAAIKTHAADLESIRNIIRQRVEAVEPAEAEATIRDVDRFIEKWASLAEKHPNLRYGHPFDTEGTLLANADVLSIDPDGPEPTLWSMRDVDLTTHLYL